MIYFFWGGNICLPSSSISFCFKSCSKATIFCFEALIVGLFYSITCVMHQISSHMILVLSGWTNLRCFSPEARFHMPALSGSQKRGFLVPLSDNMKLGVLLLSTVTQTHFLFSFPISWFYILSIDSSALIEN